VVSAAPPIGLPFGFIWLLLVAIVACSVVCFLAPVTSQRKRL
jgi:hypothetical protein